MKLDRSNPKIVISAWLEERCCFHYNFSIHYNDILKTTEILTIFRNGIDFIVSRKMETMMTIFKTQLPTS